MELFKIGHETARSETFRPDTVPSKDLGVVFVDIAGFSDTSGDMIELINCFVDKFIFNNAKSVRILCPMTIEQITASRGTGVTDLIK